MKCAASRISTGCPTKHLDEADPVNYVDEWGLSAGNAGVGVSSYSLSMSDNATSLSDEQGVTWGPTNTNNGPSLSYGGSSIEGRCAMARSEAIANAEAMDNIAYNHELAEARNWDGKVDLQKHEVPRAKTTFDAFVYNPPLETGEIEANPLFDPTGLVAGGLKLSAKVAVGAGTLAKGVVQQFAKGPGNTAVKSFVNNADDITEATIKAAMKDAPLKTQQGAVSIPYIKRYFNMLKDGDVAPPIKVDGDIIVDGNHRYIAGRLFGKVPETVPGKRANYLLSQPTKNWSDLFFDIVDWRTK